MGMSWTTALSMSAKITEVPDPDITAPEGSRISRRESAKGRRYRRSLEEFGWPSMSTRVPRVPSFSEKGRATS